jgi:spermidine/putrescine transport system permease protein
LSAGRARALLRSEGARGLLLASPPVIVALGLLVLPILVVLAHSVWTQTFLTIDRTPTFANYRQALTDPMYRTLLLRSLGVALMVSLLTVALAYPVAYLISFRAGRWKALAIFLITVPFWTSYLLRVMAWKVILGYQGILNTGLVGAGLLDEPSQAFLYNRTAVVITLTHAWAAFAVLPIFVALERVDRSMIEAARDLGDGPLRSFLRVTLPLTMPGVVAALLIVLIPTLGDYVTPQLVGGSGGMLIANAIQAQFGRAANWPLGAALAAVTMLAGTLLALAVAGALRGAVRAWR